MPKRGAPPRSAGATKSTPDRARARRDRAQADARTTPPARPTATVTRRQLALAALAITALWLGLFAPQLAGGKVFTLGDAAAGRRFSDFSHARWAEHHERTFWNPYVFAGIPAAASLADARPQWLPDVLLSAWDATTHGTPPLLPALLAHLAGMFAIAALARALWRCGVVAMVLAAAAWGLTPNLVVPMAFGHDAQFVCASLMPVVLLAIHASFAASSPAGVRAGAVALAFACAWQGFSVHPQFLVYSSTIAVAFALERAIHFRRPARLAGVAVAAAFGFAMAAAVWWPALLYGRLSVRGGDAAVVAKELASFSLAWRDLGSLVWPRAVGFGGATYWGGLRATDFPNYLGVVVALFALMALPRRRDRDAGAAVLLVAFAAFGALVALGTNLPALSGTLQRLPLWSGFRTAVNALILTQLAVALLAARGAENARAWCARGAGRRFAVIAVVALVAAVTIAALAPAMRMELGHRMTDLRGIEPEPARIEAVNALRDAALRLGLVALTLGLLAWSSWRRGTATLVFGVLPLIATLDLVAVDTPLLHRADGPASRLAAAPPPPLARLAAADPQHRAYALDQNTFFSSDWIAWRAHSISGLHGAVPQRWEDLRASGLLRRDGVVRALAVRYAGYGGVAGPRFGVESEDRFERLAGDSVLGRRDALPRAYTVARVEALAGDAAVMDAMYQESFAPERHSYGVEAAAAGEYPGSPGAAIAWRIDDPDHLELDTNASDRAFLVVADTWFPGWSATLDGRAVPLHRIDHVLRGIVLPPGAHRVAMRYVPEGWALAVVVTRVAVPLGLLLAALAGVDFVRRRRSPATVAAQGAVLDPA